MDEESLRNARVIEYEALFTKQKFQKTKTWHDGTLKYYTFNRKVVLIDGITGAKLAEEFVKKDTTIQEGQQFHLSSYMIEVGGLIGEHERDLSGAFVKQSQQNNNDNNNNNNKTGSMSKLGDRDHPVNNRPLDDIMPVKQRIRPVGLTKGKPSLNRVQNSPISRNLYNRTMSRRPLTPLDNNKIIISKPMKPLSPNNLPTPVVKTKKLTKKPATEEEPLSTKLLRISGPRLQSSRRTSRIIVGLPMPKTKNTGRLSESPKRRSKKRKNPTRIMKLHGPPRPIEIPKKLLDHLDGAIKSGTSSNSERSGDFEHSLSDDEEETSLSGSRQSGEMDIPNENNVPNQTTTTHNKLEDPVSEQTIITHKNQNDKPQKSYKSDNPQNHGDEHDPEISNEPTTIIENSNFSPSTTTRSFTKTSPRLITSSSSSLSSSLVDISKNSSTSSGPIKITNITPSRHPKLGTRYNQSPSAAKTTNLTKRPLAPQVEIYASDYDSQISDDFEDDSEDDDNTFGNNTNEKSLSNRLKAINNGGKIRTTQTIT
ncbi:hypothetical protein DASC09_017410 [Saccharomycopsis crataegensis]|uniref:5'-3' DNA helicase ZGRF1-like N-terminal domain-containing protein n=1 Tax=Saccharomycopsis crataegensis TaxID=43959 RepID=A0AAV5QIA8_9ASCO|nr:hypothetical protein DASC09_017410 [Saccharomycopsis crataegensis]